MWCRRRWWAGTPSGTNRLYARLIVSPPSLSLPHKGGGNRRRVSAQHHARHGGEHAGDRTLSSAWSSKAAGAPQRPLPLVGEGQGGGCMTLLNLLRRRGDKWLTAGGRRREPISPSKVISAIWDLGACHERDAERASGDLCASGTR